MASAIEIFFCYAREDEILRQGLEKQLRALKRQGLINLWHDREISAGAEWECEIDIHLNTAQIILLLISPDFMDSDYCYGSEMKRAMERHECGETRVIPVILRPVYWEGAPFGKLQALPTNAKPVTHPDWHNLDRAFFDIVEGIRRVINKPSLFLRQVQEVGLPLNTPKPLQERVSDLNTLVPLEEKEDIDSEEVIESAEQPVPPSTPEPKSQPRPDSPQSTHATDSKASDQGYKVKFQIGNTVATNSKQYIADRMTINNSASAPSSTKEEEPNAE